MHARACRLSSVPALHCRAPPWLAVLPVRFVPVKASSAQSQVWVATAPSCCAAELPCAGGACAIHAEMPQDPTGGSSAGRCRALSTLAACLR